MSDVGILGTLFYITYGCSKFVSGMISDRSNPRYFMGIGLVMTGIINILFGMSSSLWSLAPCGSSMRSSKVGAGHHVLKY